MNNTRSIIGIAFDGQTLLDCKVDQKIYQDRLTRALPDFRLQFSFAPGVKDSIGFPYAISIISGDAAKLVLDTARAVWPEVCGTSCQQSQNTGTEGRITMDKTKVVTQIKQHRCNELMRKICMKELDAKDVECCICGQRTLKLVKGNSANPWAQVVCTNISANIACAFKHTCGHAEPTVPENKPKLC